MMKGRLLALIVTFGLGGCAGLTQFPEVTNDYDAALRGLDADYATTLDRIYGKNPVAAAEAKLIRSEMMERRMAVIDAHFKEFQAGLVKENVRTDFGIALLGIGVGAAGSLVAETTSQILSAVSGGLAGAQAAYGKAVLYDKAMSALLAQMQAGRKVVAAQIFQRWNQDVEQYPMWMARTDLEAYYFAGSLPGAILGTAADAKVKETQADEQIGSVVRSAEFVRNLPIALAIDARLEKLSDPQALALAKAMEPHIKTRSETLQKFLNALDPKKRRLDDPNAARVFLRNFQLTDSRLPPDLKNWTDELDKVEKN
jgi:hypothetical protein